VAAGGGDSDRGRLACCNSGKLQIGAAAAGPAVTGHWSCGPSGLPVSRVGPGLAGGTSGRPVMIGNGGEAGSGPGGGGAGDGQANRAWSLQGGAGPAAAQVDGGGDSGMRLQPFCTVGQAPLGGGQHPSGGPLQVDPVDFRRAMWAAAAVQQSPATVAASAPSGSAGGGGGDGGGQGGGGGLRNCGGESGAWRLARDSDRIACPAGLAWTPAAPVQVATQQAMASTHWSNVSSLQRLQWAMADAHPRPVWEMGRLPPIHPPSLEASPSNRSSTPDNPLVLRRQGQ
jgi:hypothetical protein